MAFLLKNKIFLTILFQRNNNQHGFITFHVTANLQHPLKPPFYQGFFCFSEIIKSCLKIVIYEHQQWPRNPAEIQNEGKSERARPRRWTK